MAVVLVVEDDAAVRLTVCRYLAACKHSPLAAETGFEALSVGASKRPDAAILDLRLPDTDGLALFSELRHQRPGLVGIMLTGYASAPNAVASLQAGMADYLEKPFSLPALVNRLDELLRLTEARTMRDSATRTALLTPANRLARVLVMAIAATTPLRTLDDWAQTIGTSQATLRTWCYSADVHPREAFAFARGLWACSAAPALHVDPAGLLGVLDSRSIHRFLARSGSLREGAVTASPVAFCDRQTFIRHAGVLEEVTRLLLLRGEEGRR